MISQIEEAHFGRALWSSKQRVVIPRASVVDRYSLAPLVAAQTSPQHDVKRWKRAENHCQGEYGTERNQDGNHRHDGNAVLQERSQPLNQLHRTVSGFRARTVEVVIEIGRIVKSQIHFQRFSLDQYSDVVSNLLGLRRSHPDGQAAQELGREQDGSHPCSQNERWPYGAPLSAGTDGNHERVHDRARQIDGGDRKQTLDNQQKAPKNCQTGRYSPDYCQCARKIAQLCGKLADAYRYVLEGS